MNLEFEIGKWEQRLRMLGHGERVYLEAFKKDARTRGLSREEYLQALKEVVVRLESTPRDSSVDKEVREMKIPWSVILLLLLGIAVYFLRNTYGDVVLVAAAILLVLALAVSAWIKFQAAKVKTATRVVTGGTRVAAKILGIESPVAEEQQPKAAPAGGFPWGPLVVILLLVVLVGAGFLLGPQIGLPELLDQGKVAVSKAREGWSRSEEVSPEEATDEGALAPTTKAKKAVPTATTAPSLLAEQMSAIFTALKEATKGEGKKQVEDPFPPIGSAKLEGGERFADQVRTDIESLANTTKRVEKQAAELMLQWWDALVAGKTEKAEQVASEMENLLPALAQLGDEGPVALAVKYKGKSSSAVAEATVPSGGKASSVAGPTLSSSGGSSVTYRSSTPAASRAEVAPTVAPTAAAVRFLKGSEMVSRPAAYQTGFEILRARGLKDPVKLDQKVNEVLDTLAKLAEEGAFLDVVGNFKNVQVDLPVTPTRELIPTGTPVPAKLPLKIKNPTSPPTPVPPTVPPTPRWINPAAVIPPTQRPMATVLYPPTNTPTPSFKLPMIIKAPTPVPPTATPTATPLKLPLIVK